MSVLLSACGFKGDLYQIVEPKLEQNITVEDPLQNNKNTIKDPIIDTITDTQKKSK